MSTRDLSGILYELEALVVELTGESIHGEEKVRRYLVEKRTSSTLSSA